MLGWILAMVLTFAVPMAAVAAAAAPLAEWHTVSATLYDLEPGKEPTLVIVGVLPNDTKLPAQVGLAIPKGSTPLWAGEVLGGDPASDPSVEVELETHQNYDVLLFTLSKSPVAQIELTPSPGTVTPMGSTEKISLSWTSDGRAQHARVAVASPLGYHLTDATPTPAVEVLETDVRYSLETTSPADGDTVTLSGILVAGDAPEVADATATPPAIPAAVSDAPSPARPLPWTTVFLALVVIALLAAIVTLVLKLRGNRES